MAIKPIAVTQPRQNSQNQLLSQQRQMAALLQAQASQPMEGGRMVGRVYVPTHPMQGVAKMGNSLMAAMMMNRADEKQKELQEQQLQDRNNTIAEILKATSQPDVSRIPEIDPRTGEIPNIPADPNTINKILLASNNQYLSNMGLQNLINQTIPQGDPYTLKPGEVRYGANNQQVAQGLPVQPKPAATSPLFKLIQDREKFPEGSLERELIEARINKLNHINPPATNNVNVSVGGKEVDKVYAQEFVDWTTGSFADTMKGLDQLKLASKELGEDKSITGAGKGFIPDSVRAITNPKAVANKNKVEEVVQRNLRVILGAQFTEKEGVRLIERAYNPDLPTSENKRRVDALIKQIETAARAKNEAAKYFRKHKTLDGFNGELPDINDFNPDILYRKKVSRSSDDEWTDL